MILKENLFLNRYEWASEKIKNIINDQTDRSLTVFDIGSRDNILFPYIKDCAITYMGFDMDPIVDQANKWNIEDPFPYPYASPQIVTLLEVVEHLNNPSICLKNIADLMKPGSYLILTTPNPKWSNGRISLLVSGELSCFSQSDLDLNHHVFTPWVHIIERLLADSGFEIIEYVTLDGNTKIFDKNLSFGTFVKRLTTRLIKKFIEYRDPTSRGMSYGVIAKKVA